MSRKCRCKKAPIIFQQTLNINCGSGLALPPSLGLCPANFGTGLDTDLIIPSGMSLVMTRDYNFNTLTVQAGGMIVTNGFNLFVNGLLTLNGTIQNNGGNGSATGPGFGGGGGSAGGQPSANVFAPNTSGGGNGGAATPSTAPLDESLTALSLGRIQNTAGVKYTGGAGGDNPGGGGGGGVIGIFARQIVSSNSAIIQANGGNGFGGGGGGGGGLVFIFAGENLSQPSILPTLQALGGQGNAEGQVGNIVTIFCTAP